MPYFLVWLQHDVRYFKCGHKEFAWYDELKLLKGTHVCRSNTHPDMKSHVVERLATDRLHTSASSLELT